MEEQKFSGERFIPEMNDAELEIEHLQRYCTVSEHVANWDVLDAACGEGYGSRILAEMAKSVVGIDIDAATIASACKKYSDCHNLQFYQGSIADLSMIKSQSKDAVISFETIEHVSRELQEAFLKEIKRVLKPEGILIMSTPDKKEYSDRYQFHNQFHVAEFYVDEFIAFLSQEFQNIQLYNQYLEVASFIDLDHIDREYMLYVKDSSKYNPKGKYVIAIAGNSPLPEINLSSVFMHHRAEYLPTLDELNYCRSEAITCRKKVEKLDECLNECKLQREELERRAIELDKRMDLINELNQNCTEWNDKYNELQRKSDECLNERKLQKEELERRAVELDKRMDLINKLNQNCTEWNDKYNELQRKLDECLNERKLQKEELERRAIELDKRMDLINELNRNCVEWDEKYNQLQCVHSEVINKYDRIRNKTLKDLLVWYFSLRKKE